LSLPTHPQVPAAATRMVPLTGTRRDGWADPQLVSASAPSLGLALTAAQTVRGVTSV
jgi:hypothetical protein